MTEAGMTSAIEHVQPEALWGYFERICSIPHDSGSEYALGEFICGLARDAGCSFKKDAAGNICLYVPATPGYEKAETVILQGHLDMVCEKHSGHDFNFSSDAIQLVRQGEWIRANSTSLGADNGIGIAAALAAAFTKGVHHGPLEILLTIEEETGLKGAMKLDPALVSGKILFNLDYEKTGVVGIGCAGGGRMTVRLPLHFIDAFPGHTTLSLRLDGLRGGHSGLNIHENRGNAVKSLTYLLASCLPMKTALFSLAGGDKLNAIPREATAVISMPAESVERFRSDIMQSFDLLSRALPHEPTAALSVEETEAQPQAVPPVVCSRILNLLQALPSGVFAMSREIPGLVETSCNLAAVCIRDVFLEVELMPRSSHSRGIDQVSAQINAVAELAGADSESEVPFPEWQPDLDSKILKVVDEVHKELFGALPQREATHAGLECGIIGKKCPGIDMISFGPDIKDCHSPSEKVFIPGVEKLWLLLTGVLDLIAKKGIS